MVKLSMATNDDTPTRILNAAGPVFAERGFQNATVREICAAAGVNLASINYYFRDKERLYIETVKRAAQLRAEQVPMPVWPVDLPAAEKIRSFVRTLLSRMLDSEQAPWQVRLMLREILQPGAATKELVHGYFRPHVELLAGVLAEVLPPETPFDRRQKIVFSIIGQCLHYRVAHDVVRALVPEEALRSHFSTEQLAEHITQFSLAALGLAPPLPAQFAAGTRLRSE